MAGNREQYTQQYMEQNFWEFPWSREQYTQQYTKHKTSSTNANQNKYRRSNKWDYLERERKLKEKRKKKTYSRIKSLKKWLVLETKPDPMSPID